jgi:hypothetical protein
MKEAEQTESKFWEDVESGEYKVLQATSFVVLGSKKENFVFIGVKDDDSKTIVGSELNIKDAQHIFSKLLTWDKSIQ